MVEILDLTASPKSNKRYRIFIDDNGDILHYDFGAKNGQTYIDHGDKSKRNAYLRRHLANPIEKNRIENLIPSPALFAAALLWGNNTNLVDNVLHLNSLFKQKK